MLAYRAARVIVGDVFERKRVRENECERERMSVISESSVCVFVYLFVCLSRESKSEVK